MTRKQSLEAGRRQLAKLKSQAELKKMFSELEPVKLVPGSEHLLGIFSDLSFRRQYTDNGAPQAITFSEIAAYNQLTGALLQSWEIRLITAMDVVFCLETCKHLEKSMGA